MKSSFAILVPIFVLMLLPSVIGSSSSESTSSNNGTASATVAPSTEESEVIRKWKEMESFLKKTSTLVVKNVLPEAVRAFQELELSTNCSRSLMKLLSGIKQMKLWAFRMLDSSGKIPEGIYRGSVASLGDYDTCVDTEVPRNFRGQFCNVDLLLPLPERERFVPGSKIIKELVNFTSDKESVMAHFISLARYFYRLKIRSAVCVPSTCSRGEVERIAVKAMNLVGLSFNLTVLNCETKVDKVVFNVSEMVIITVLCSLFLTSVAATFADVVLKMRSQEESYQKNLSVPMKCLMCFSLYTNFIRLLKKDRSPDSIKIFHGMKVVTILWVILNHTIGYISYQAMKSGTVHALRAKDLLFQFVLNGFINVETFFFISAVLLAYGHMKSKEQSVNVFRYVVRRIWRLAPPFMLVIACVYLVPHLGSGPVWREMVVEELTEKCKENWWTNLLFINNLFPRDAQCMHWMWYIPADTHLYFISLLVIIPLKRNPKLAFKINALLFVVFVVVTAAIHVVYRIPPTGLFVMTIEEDINYYIDNHYFKTWVHFSTYSVGLTVGYFLATKQKIHIPMKFNILGWITSFTLGITVVYGVYDWNQGNFPGVIVSTLYACTNKLAFALALAWVTITCVTGNSGVVTSILGWDAFVPLGRLTYMTYLIHPIIQHMYMGSYRAVYIPDNRTMVFSYVSYVVLSFMCACGLSMLFESPFLALERVLMTSQRRPCNHSTNDKEVEIGDQKHNGILHLNVDNGIYTINVKQIENDR